MLLSALGCTHPLHHPDHFAQDQSVALGNEIIAIADSIRPENARALAHMLIQSTADLMAEYQTVRPPRYHNLLVHLGLRTRGLCCHWAEDLRLRLLSVNQTAIRFDWLVVHHNKPLHEHNSLVLHAAGAIWREGLVYDPWRKSGHPYWVRVTQDKFVWQQHPLSGQWDQLRCNQGQ